jgi:hypothetical protein
MVLGFRIICGQRENGLIATDEAICVRGLCALVLLALDSLDGCPCVVIYTLKEDPQPQVLFTFGFSNLKPAPSRVST